MIEIDHITHRYGPRVALDDVSLDCPAGGMLALLGPNGSGKSTLFRLLSTHSPVQAGSIRINGLDVMSERDRVRPLIGAAFQSPALDGQLTVMENLLCHASLFGINANEARSRAVVLLARFDVAARERERVTTLSGGLRRRVELAKALISQPRMLIMDEPSAGLDPDARRQLRELLGTMRDDGMTIAIATHDTDEADLADTVAILNEGKLAGVGSPVALRERVGGMVVRVELSDPAVVLPELPAEVMRIVVGSIVEYHLPDPRELMGSLMPMIGRGVRSVQAGPPSLASAYFQLTGRLLDSNS